MGRHGAYLLSTEMPSQDSSDLTPYEFALISSLSPYSWSGASEGGVSTRPLWHDERVETKASNATGQLDDSSAAAVLLHVARALRMDRRCHDAVGPLSGLVGPLLVLLRTADRRLSLVLGQQRVLPTWRWLAYRALDSGGGHRVMLMAPAHFA